MKKIILLLLSSFISIHLFSQDSNFDYEKYDWKKTIPSYAPQAEDLKYSSTVVDRKRYIEFKYGSGGGLEKYLVIHDLIMVNDDKAIEENNKFYLPIEQEQALVQLKVRVIEKGKIVFEAGKPDLLNIEQENHTYKLLAIKGLSKGTMVEKIIGIQIEPSMNETDFIQEDDPIKNYFYQIKIPKNLVLRCKTYNTSASVKDTTVGDMTYYCLRSSNIMPLEDEKYSYLTPHKQRLEYAFKKNEANNVKAKQYSDIGREYFENVMADYDDNAKDIESIIKKLKIAPSATLDEKIFAVECYLKTNLLIERNIPKFKKASQAIKSKAVSTFDMVRLLAWMTKSQGISVELVLTIGKDTKKFDTDFENRANLQNVLFYFPQTGKYSYPENIIYRYGTIPSDYQGQQGLFIRSVEVGGITVGASQVKMIQEEKYQDNMDQERFTVTFKNNLEAVNIDYYKAFVNSLGLNYRIQSFLMDDEKRKEFLETVIKGTDKDAKVTDAKAENRDLNKYEEWTKPFAIKGKVESKFYLEKAGDVTLFKIGELIGTQVQMYEEKERTLPIEIFVPHGYDRILKIEIPEGYSIKGLDALNMSFDYKDKQERALYGFKSWYEMKENTLIVYCKEYYAQSEMPKENIQTFIKVVNAAADFNKITLAIGKK